jgi:16S rRNA processing protein RimM
LSPIEVGYVARVHGLRGELRIVLHWEGSPALARGRLLMLRKGERSLTARVESVRGAGKGSIVKLDALSGRDAAEAWSGAAVLADRAEQPALEAGEYYLSDLVGAEVYVGDELIGSVTEIACHPSVDSLIIHSHP